MTRAGNEQAASALPIRTMRWLSDRLRARPTRPVGHALAIAALLALLAAVATRAWVGEDAFITYRTIDHLLSGHGLRWNVDERVQTYTHPLWLLVQIPFYVVLRDIPSSAAAAGVLTSAIALTLLLLHFAERPAVALLAVALPLALSRSFLLYSTSGFENPLSHLWAIAFAIVLLGEWRADQPPWARLVGIAALAAVTRLDSILLYLPSLAVLALARAPAIPWRRCLAAAAPLFAWSAFSLFYYGSAIPNTAPAKLSPHLPLLDYLAHGVGYVANLVRTDVVSAGLLLVGSWITLSSTGALARRQWWSQEARLAGLGLGMLLYCAYVVRIGGDFLSGRFWSLAVVTAVILVAARLDALVSAERPVSRRSALGCAVALAVLVAVHATQASALQALEPGRRIMPLSLAHYRLDRDLRFHPSPTARRMKAIGARARAEAGASGEGLHVVVLDAVGIAGVEAGPDVSIIDFLAIGDPLLSRMKPAVERLARIGHVPRELPQGYESARRTGSLETMDPDLRIYYGAIRSITRDPLSSPQRLRTLLAFQLGAYDGHLDAYTKRTAEPPTGGDE